MKVSLNTIKQLVDFELPPVEELVQRINEQLGGVEAVVMFGEKYAGATVVRVVSCEPHPNADRLSICTIDDGGAVEDIERDENGRVQVVCGAPNVHADMFAVWLPPRSIVPATVDDDEPFVLGTRELRGVMSNGMLAAGDELAINSDHDGIIELTEADVPSGVEKKSLAAGQDFAELFGLDDTIIDIENKMFTHRPDCFGQIGVAREIAGIFGHDFTDPKWYVELFDQVAPTHSFSLDGFNECSDKVPRLTLTGYDNVTVGPSPLWLQAKLLALGGKTINNIVDITNYVMYMTAQPTHAYDYDKLRGGTVGARMAHDGERATLLNGKTYTLTSDDIVIADANGVIGLGGIMGGGESEVGPETTRIVLEVASFDMYTIRKTSMRYGLFTDALARFNKGQSMLMNPYIAQYTAQLLSTLSGATRATEKYDDLMSGDEWRAKPDVTPMLEAREIETKFINDRLGSKLKTADIVTMLTNVGFECSELGQDTLRYWAPAWRMDIQDPEDLVEEVGRLYGFDKLPRELPQRSIAPVPRNAMRTLKQRIRESLARSGANEVLTYSFVHQNIMNRAQQNASEAYVLSNALSPELQYYRLSVLPSLLDKVHMNSKLGYDEFTLFEIGKAHNKADDKTHELPRERELCDAVYTSRTAKPGAPYFHIRRQAEQVARDLGVTLRFTPMNDTVEASLAAPFEQSRSAIIESDQGEFIGIIGELKQPVRKAFKLPDYTAAMTIDIHALHHAASHERTQYRPLSRFPSTSQDISLRTAANVRYDELLSAVIQAAEDSSGGLRYEITPVSIYQADDQHDTKTTTFHVVMTSNDRTLTDEDIAPIMNQLALAASERFGAKRV